MADRNIQIKNKKGSTWDNLYPITTMDNVFDKNGKALSEQVDIISSQDFSSEERLLNAHRDINVPERASHTIFETSSAPHSFFPAIVRNTSGKLYSYYRKSGWHGVDVNAKIYCKESDNNGVTWTNERIIVNNIGFDPRDPDVLLASDGKIIMKWFDHNGTEVHSKIKISTDGGATFGADVTLPKPPNYNGSMVATKGKFIEVSGVFYICLYTAEENKAYVVKSSNLVNWEFVSYIHESILLNETSLCYIESEQALYAISRQAKKTNENVRFQDYANKLFLSKSLDNGTTWTQSYELPVYGHAPVAVPFGDEILISYKNTYTLGNDNRYTLDICKLKNGKLNGYPKTLALSTGKDNFDVFYSDILVENTKVFLTFYTYAHGSSRVGLFIFNKEEMNKIAFNDTVYENVIGADGWRASRDGIIEAWKEHTVTYTLQPDEKKLFNLSNVRGFPTRPLGIQAYIADVTPYGQSEVYDNIVLTTRILNAAGDIRVMLWNTNDSSLTVNKIRTYTFGM